MSEAQRFIRRVWAKQPQGFRFLSVKDWGNGAWTDHPIAPAEGLVIPTYDDLYFCPNTFRGGRRRKSRVEPGRWLYADLDEADPYDVPKGLQPTIAWETSPDRYQALWQLTRLLRPEDLGRINQKLTYALGADRGGWHLTKVLRVPGTFNNKRDERVRVRCLWDDGPVYGASEIWESVKGERVPLGSGSPLPSYKPPRRPAKVIREKIYPSLPLAGKKLLGASVLEPGEDRSARLWQLEHYLLEAGLTPAETLVVVRESVYNKYSGQQREETMLWTEINKVAQELGIGPEGNGLGQQSRRRGSDARGKSTSRDAASGMERRGSGRSNGKVEGPVDLHDFIDQYGEKPQWMIENIWSEAAHGLVVGPEKTFKSIIAMDMAVSVASGTPFLGRFPVPISGPAVYLQHENHPAEVRDRFQRICYARGLWGHGLVPELPPVKVWNNPDLDLADEDDREKLVKLVDEARPKLLILDPFYMLAPNTDENSAREVVPILRSLLDIKTTYGCGTLIIHHFSKPSENRKGLQRASGSGTFSRWYESALQVERPSEEEPVVKLIPTHRGQPSGKSVVARFSIEGDLGYEVEVEGAKEAVAKEFNTIRSIVDSAGGAVPLSQVGEALGVGTKAAKRRVLDAQGVKLVKRGGSLWVAIKAQKKV